jgi:carbon storage regulator CsrA
MHDGQGTAPAGIAAGDAPRILEADRRDEAPAASLVLVLTRKTDEKIVVSDADGNTEVEITVVEIEPPQRPGSRARVRLGISAPHKHVYRSELKHRMNGETECTNASPSSS